MSTYDAPNQQVVRPDGSAPWEEGSGGSGSQVAVADELDGMTKDELLERAQELGVTPANAGMTKDELRAGIDARLAEDA